MCFTSYPQPMPVLISISCHAVAMKTWEIDFEPRYKALLPRNRRAESIHALREIIKDMYTEGYGVAEIGRYLGYPDHTSISHHLVVLGFSPQAERKEDTKKRSEKIAALYSSGVDVGAISKGLGIAREYIYDTLRASGIKMRSRNEVIQRDSDGKVVTVFGSALEASKKTGFIYRRINFALHNAPNNIYAGYRWEITCDSGVIPTE